MSSGNEAVPFIDLKAQYKRCCAEIDVRIRKVLDHGHYILGAEVEELEKALASYVGTQFGIGCSSGTDALLVTLMALGIGRGDAVFTTPFTFFATAEVIALLGAVPVFVDIEAESYNINPDALESAIIALKSRKTRLYPLPQWGSNSDLNPKAVIAVDLFGLPSRYDRLDLICQKYNLALIEDAAQSFGGKLKEKRNGSFGIAAATSFFPAKPLGCYGDGGMVFTDNERLGGMIRSLIVHGKGSDKYDNIRIGLNGRLDTLQAAILLAKVECFESELQRRQIVASKYTCQINELIGHGACTPSVPSDCLSAWAQYTIRLPGKWNLKVQNIMQEHGVPTAIYYSKPLHLQPAFESLRYCKGDFPEAELASREVLSLPFGPYLTEAQQAIVVETLHTVLVEFKA